MRKVYGGCGHEEITGTDPGACVVRAPCPACQRPAERDRWPLEAPPARVWCLYTHVADREGWQLCSVFPTEAEARAEFRVWTERKRPLPCRIVQFGLAEILVQSV